VIEELGYFPKKKKKVTGAVEVSNLYRNRGKGSIEERDIRLRSGPGDREL